MKIICKKCGTEIRGGKPEEQYTPAEVREFRAVVKIMSEHPNWDLEQAHKELRVKRFYWSYMKWKKANPDEYKQIVEEEMAKIIEEKQSVDILTWK